MTAVADFLRDVSLRDVRVSLPGRPTLCVRLGDGPLRPFLLVHGVGTGAALWDAVALRLLRAGHTVAAVDLRGHGGSDTPADGYDTDTVADDLAALVETLGFTGGRAPVAVGHSWGGNVTMSLAARRGGVAAVCGVGGGWIRLAARFGSFDDCWRELAPPVLDGVRYAELAERIAQLHPDWPPAGVAATLAGLRELPDGGVAARLPTAHYRAILRSLYRDSPQAWYARVRVPVLLYPAVPVPVAAEAAPTGRYGRRDRTAGARERATHEGVAEALAALPRARVTWYAGTDHELLVRDPARLSMHLLALANDAEPDVDRVAVDRVAADRTEA